MTVLRSLRTLHWRHPRVELAVKTALAGCIAWLLVQPLGGFLQQYPYYAPLGAVVAMSTTVASSVRSAACTVGALLLGAALGLGVRTLELPEPAAIAGVVGVGTLLAGWRLLGTQASWVPIAALFVLILGRRHPLDYAAAYGGLTALGAAVGVGVNMLLPQLPLTPAVLAQDRLRRDLADQLDLLADGLENEEVLSEDDWDETRYALGPQAHRVDQLVGQAMEARRGNWQARRWAEAADRRYDQARALQRLTGCVDEVISLVGDVRTPVHGDEQEAADLRTACARAFRAVATMLRSADDGDEDAPATMAQAAAGAVAELRREVVRVTTDAASDRYLAGAAIAVSLDQAVEAWT